MMKMPDIIAIIEYAIGHLFSPYYITPLIDAAAIFITPLLPLLDDICH
jgi:hypothetical protein